MQVQAHHRLLIRAHLDHIAWLEQMIPVVQDELEAALDAIPAAWGVTATASPARTRGRAPPSCPPRSGSRRSPASAGPGHARSSPRPAWT